MRTNLLALRPVGTLLLSGQASRQDLRRSEGRDSYLQGDIGHWRSVIFDQASDDLRSDRRQPIATAPVRSSVGDSSFFCMPVSQVACQRRMNLAIARATAKQQMCMVGHQRPRKARSATGSHETECIPCGDPIAGRTPCFPSSCGRAIRRADNWLYRRRGGVCRRWHCGKD